VEGHDKIFRRVTPPPFKFDPAPLLSAKFYHTKNITVRTSGDQAQFIDKHDIIRAIDCER